MTAYLERELASAVLSALKEMPVVITGMRQTGKTTFLQRQSGFEGRRYVTFDDLPQREAAKSGLDGFVNSSESLTIDEAQKCPEILTAIKMAVDKRQSHYRPYLDL